VKHKEATDPKCDRFSKLLCALLESIADDQDWQADPSEWSFRYIAAHLATVDRDCYLDRVNRISAGENPYFEAYYNTGWDFSQFALSDSLRAWKTTRKKILELVDALPEDKLLLSAHTQLRVRLQCLMCCE